MMAGPPPHQIAQVDFDLSAKNARFFVIKSYSEDDIYRSIKYEIWSSTEHGNKRLDQAFREREGKGVVYLFFSVNGSGHFCGMAKMVSPVDYHASSSVWSYDKCKGQFRVKWIHVKDVPNVQLRHIRLENNENKSVTNSRDTQEVPFEKGKQVLKVMHVFKHSTSIFDDFEVFEKRQEEEDSMKEPPPSQHHHKEKKRPFKKNVRSRRFDTKITDVNMMVFDIIGNDLPVIEGLGVKESMSDSDNETLETSPTELIETPIPINEVIDNHVEDTPCAEVEVFPVVCEQIIHPPKASVAVSISDFHNKKLALTVELMEKEIRLKELDIQNKEREIHLINLKILKHELELGLPTSKFTEHLKPHVNY